MSRLRRVVRPLAERAAAGPVGRLVERVSRGGPAFAVLVYHRVLPRREGDRFSLVVSEKRFAEQVRFLTRRYPVLRLDRALEDLEAGRLPARRAVAITFDDGYRDVGTRAVPILEKLGAPATIFLSTSSAASGEPYWWDLLEAPGHDVPDEVHHRARGMPPDERDRLVASIEGDYRPTRPEDFPMRYSEVRALPETVSIAGHGDRHLSLGLAGAAAARADAEACAIALAREVPAHVRLFAYPFGTAADVTGAAVEAVRDAGFVAAFTTEDGVVRRGADRFRLPRLRAFDEGAGALALRLMRAFSARRSRL